VILSVSYGRLPSLGLLYFNLHMESKPPILCALYFRPGHKGNLMIVFRSYGSIVEVIFFLERQQFEQTVCCKLNSLPFYLDGLVFHSDGIYTTYMNEAPRKI
jgi:hypothetical protein